MAKGREEVEWNRLSHLMAQIFNCNIWDAKKMPPMQPKAYNPFLQDKMPAPNNSFAKAKQTLRAIRGGQPSSNSGG